MPGGCVAVECVLDAVGAMRRGGCSETADGWHASWFLCACWCSDVDACSVCVVTSHVDRLQPRMYIYEPPDGRHYKIVRNRADEKKRTSSRRDKDYEVWDIIEETEQNALLTILVFFKFWWDPLFVDKHAKGTHVSSEMYDESKIDEVKPRFVPDSVARIDESLIVDPRHGADPSQSHMGFLQELVTTRFALFSSLFSSSPSSSRKRGTLLASVLSRRLAPSFLYTGIRLPLMGCTALC